MPDKEIILLPSAGPGSTFGDESFCQQDVDLRWIVQLLEKQDNEEIDGCQVSDV